MTESTTLHVRVERTDGPAPIHLPSHTEYSGGWGIRKAAESANDDARRVHDYDGTIRVYVWPVDRVDRTPDDAPAPDDSEVFDFPAGSLAAQRAYQKRRMEIYNTLRRKTKAQLCAMLRSGGLVWSSAPPERWTKDEVLNAVIDQKERTT